MNRKRVIAELHQEIAQQSDNLEELLWDCFVAYQDCVFYTSSGLPFSYTVKRKRMVTTVVSFWYLVRKVVKR